MEKLEGDLLLGLTFVKLEILTTFIDFLLEEFKFKILGIKTCSPSLSLSFLCYSTSLSFVSCLSTLPTW